MSRVKIEAGQLWQARKGKDTKTILATYKNNDDDYAAYIYETGAGKNGSSCGFVALWDHYTLITNADGTPYVKPNDYQDGDIWAFSPKGKVAKYGEACLITVRDGFTRVLSTYSDKPIELWAGFKMHPQNYKLIYRKGQGVINDA